MRKITMALAIIVMAGCSSTPRRERVFLDSSLHEDSPPKWVRSLKTTFEESGKIFLKSSHSIRGDERTNGCFDLAKFDSKENILSEVANEIKGSIDNAQTSINENAETILGKVRSGQFEGKVTGLRFEEEYWERYSIGDVERVECHVLGTLTKEDFNQIRKAVLFKVQEADPKLKAAILNKQIRFFDEGSSGPARETASVPTSAASEGAKK